MKKPIPRRRIAILLLAVVLAGGCGWYRKRGADKAIKRVEEKNVAQAQQVGADRYAADHWQKLQREIADAKSKVEAGQYDEATTIAQQAEATAQMAIQTAQKNRGRIEAKKTEVESILKQAGEFLQRAREAPPESIPDSEVGSAEESIGAVRNLLQETTGARVQEAEDYDGVIESASAAYRASQYAYNLTLQDQASELADSINVLREKALSLNPAEYMPEETEEISASWNQFDTYFREQRYEEALAMGDELSTSTLEFIEVLGERRAEMEVENAREARDAVLEQGASTYALEPMRECERALSAAEEAVGKKRYDAAYEAALESQQAAADARAEILSRAEEIVQRVREEIEGAEEEGAREHTPEILQQARKQYGDASLALERGELKKALETGTSALQQAAAAILETKKEKARLALDRSQRSIDIAIEEGANTYAPEELAKAREKHRVAEQYFKDGSYAQVHQLAAEAEEQSGHVLEVLAERTREFIDQAEAGRQSAIEAKADELAAETLEESAQRLGEARALLGGRRYQQAIDAAKAALQLARSAESTAYRLRTEEMMARAQAAIDEAQKAGAANYAPVAYNAALDERRQAQERYDAGAFSESLDHATRSLEQAVTARREKLDAAIASVNSASEALAADYAADLFNRSLEELSTAKSQMDARAYEDSNRAADRARSLSAQSEEDAWEARSREIVDAAATRIDYLTANLGQQRCPDEMAAARLSLADTVRLLETGKFQESYNQGVETRQSVEDAEACLASQAEAAYQEFSDRYDALTALGIDPEGRKEASRLFPVLSEIEKALKQKSYRVVFERSAEGLALAEEVEEELVRHNVEVRIASLRKAIADYKETGQAEILPNEFAGLERDVMALEPAVLPVEYTDAMAVLDEMDTRVEQYGERVDMAIDTVLLDIKQTLTEARHAGALKYVRGEYETSVELYKRAVALPARENYHELAESVHAASEAAAQTLSQTLVSIDETGYKDIIRNYMLEMNSLLDRWPFGPQRGTGKYDMDVILASRSSQDIDVYHELQRDLSDIEFRDRTNELYTTVQQVTPPPSMRELHTDVLAAFRTVNEAADLFFRYGLYSIYGSTEREKFLQDAYDKLLELEKHTVAVQARLEGLEPPKPKPLGGVFHSDRGWDPRNYFWIRYDR